MGGGEVTIV